MTNEQSQPVAARFVGQAVVRKEDRRLITGHGRHVDDVSPPRLAFAAFLRSDVAKGTITRLDVSAAEERDEVLAVFTGERFLPHHGQGWHSMLGPMMVTSPPQAVGSVKHVGDPVAMVIATSATPPKTPWNRSSSRSTTPSRWSTIERPERTRTQSFTATGVWRPT
jgi:aerobic carbon-monoxide dehydrogenase large subunit